MFEYTKWYKFVHTLKMKGISLEFAWITSSLVTGDTEKFSSLYHRKEGADVYG